MSRGIRPVWVADRGMLGLSFEVNEQFTRLKTATYLSQCKKVVNVWFSGSGTSENAVSTTQTRLKVKRTDQDRP